ncbi:MAG: flavodoxin family protein [Planctomycetota bacterium]|nr:MAG: flavodoxin family protein [Planctomycetota bacterium]
MKITAFNGSPWGPTSNTQIIVDEFLAGATDAGAKTETILLQQRDIRPCKGCFDCLVNTPGKCSVKDEMPKLLKKFMASDIVVFATPLYIDNVSGPMKIFMDRLIQLVEPHFEKAPDGRYRHRKRFPEYPKFAVIANGHLPEQAIFDVLRLLFRRLARNMHTELVAEVYRPTGGLLRSQDITFKKVIKEYKLLLRKAGSELAKEGKFTEQTVELLEKQLMDPDQYAEYANEQWDNMLLNA